MHAHHQQVTYAALAQKAVDLAAIVGNHILGSDGEQRNFARPCFVKGLAGITAATTVIDGQRRILETQLSGWLDHRDSRHARPLRPILVELHGLRRRVDNLNATRAGLIDQRRHPPGQQRDPAGGARAPVFVPHIADQDGRLPDWKECFETGFLPNTAAFKGLHARPQRKPKVGPQSGPGQDQRQCR